MQLNAHQSSPTPSLRPLPPTYVTHNENNAAHFTHLSFFPAQSDIIHQSALELIHSEDRDEFKSQLNWRSRLPQDHADMTIQQVLMPGRLVAPSAATHTHHNVLEHHSNLFLPQNNCQIGMTLFN